MLADPSPRNTAQVFSSITRNRAQPCPVLPAIPVFKPFLTGGHGDRGLSVTLKVAANPVFKPDLGRNGRFPFWSRSRDVRPQE